LKRVYKINGGIMLHSENPNYPNTIINAKDHRDVKILGKAVAFKSRII
jgi:repressor LexA